jgi:hypothetical protein
MKSNNKKLLSIENIKLINFILILFTLISTILQCLEASFFYEKKIGMKNN